MENEFYRMLDIDQLLANYATVSENKCGFFLCRRGSADLLLNNKSFHVEAGMMCIYTPYTFIRIVQHSPDIGGCLMEGGLDAIQPALSDIHIADRLYIRSHPCVRLGDAQVARIEELFNTIGNRTALARESCSPRSARLRGMVVQSLLQAFCLEVLDIYFNSAPVEELPQDCEERIFNRFFMSVFRNCERERAVSYYANEQSLSPNYLSSVIKSHSDRTAMQWIETLTILKAKHSLRFTKLTIKEIAYKMHFPDQSVFGRYFKKHCGMSPSDYRNKAAE